MPLQPITNEMVRIFRSVQNESTAKWLRSTDNVRFLDKDGMVVSNKKAAYVDADGNIVVTLQSPKIFVYLDIIDPPIIGEGWIFNDPNRVTMLFNRGAIDDCSIIPDVGILKFQNVHFKEMKFGKKFQNLRSLFFLGAANPIKDSWVKFHTQASCGILSILKIPKLTNIVFETYYTNWKYEELVKALQILNVYKQMDEPSVIECQIALMDAGLDSYAEL